MPPVLIKATYNDYSGISHVTDSLSSLSKEIQDRSATNLVVDVAILLSFKFCRLLFSSFKERSKMSQPIRSWGGHLRFSTGSKNKLGRECWDFALCQVSFTSVKRFQRWSEQIEKIPRVIQGEKSRKIYGKFGKTGLINWSINKSQKGERNQVSGRVSFPCHTCCKCFMETTRNSVKVLVSRSWKLAESLIGCLSQP